MQDGFDSVGDCYHSGAAKLTPDGLLNQLVGFDVNVGSGLVYQNQFVLAQDGSGYADELFLSNRKVLS